MILHCCQDLTVLDFNRPCVLHGRCVGVFLRRSCLVVQEKGGQVQSDTVDGVFQSVTNISGNFQKLPTLLTLMLTRSCKFTVWFLI